MSLMVSYNLAIKRKNPKFYEQTDIVRLNSPWYTEEELIDALDAVNKIRFLDINIKKRTKAKKTDHNYKRLLEIAGKHNVEWVGISNIEDPDSYDTIKKLIDNADTKICAKIESKAGWKRYKHIMSKFDGIMVDVEDLASEVGWFKAAAYKDQIYEECVRENKPHFRLAGVIFEYKHKNQKIIYTYGAWDILHPGHIRMLEKAKSFGDVLYVGVVGDNAIKKLKGEDRPIQKLEDRMRIIESLRYVDGVVVQETYDPVSNLEKIKPDILVKGDDWEHIPGEEWVKENGKLLIKPSYSGDWSTSKMVKRIRETK